MKRFLVLAVIVMAAISCKRNIDPGFEVRPTLAGPNPLGLPEVVLPLKIDENRTLTSDTCYILDGKCYVTNNKKLTIEEGTRIEGIKKATNDLSSALIITRGSQIDAQGSSTNAIVFTSHEQTAAVGDWGGIVLLGRADINKGDTSIEGIDLPTVPEGVEVKYGGTNDHDNSGTLRFVRIEYAGARVSDNNELNGLTCGGVGDSTTLDFIEVALGADDAFEFFGGSVNAKHLIAFSQNDDAFDFDFGYRGSIQFAVHVRRLNEVFADGNGVESDNDGQASGDSPQTQAVLSNLTVLGLSTAAEATAPGRGMLNAARLRRNTNYIIRNSVFAGYPNGIAFDNGGSPGAPSFVDNFQNNTVHGYNNVFTTVPALPASNTTQLGGDANTTLLLTDPFNPTAPDFRPTSGSPLLTASTDYTGLPASIRAVSFRGAFDTGDGEDATWDLGGWARYDY